MKNMRYYYYLDGKNQLIRIKAKRKPYPREASYVVYIVYDGEFNMACFPEISGNRLIKMKYLGSEVADGL